MQRGAGRLHRLPVGDRMAQQQFGFRQVRGDHAGQRQQARAQRVECGVGEQLGAGGGDHDRIQHHERRQVRIQCVGHGMDHLRRRQHAELDRADVEIVEAGIQLRAQEVDRRHVDRADAARVLRGQRGDRTEAVHAMRGEGLEVGLDAGAAAGIGAGDGECAGRALFGGHGVDTHAAAHALRDTPSTPRRRCRSLPLAGTAPRSRSARTARRRTRRRRKRTRSPARTSPAAAVPPACPATHGRADAEVGEHAADVRGADHRAAIGGRHRVLQPAGRRRAAGRPPAAAAGTAVPPPPAAAPRSPGPRRSGAPDAACCPG